MYKRILYTLIVFLIFADGSLLGADKKKDKTESEFPSVTRGDYPPGNAALLTLTQARANLNDAINKKYQGKVKYKGIRPWSFDGSQINAALLPANGAVLSHHLAEALKSLFIAIDLAECEKGPDYFQVFQDKSYTCSEGDCYTVALKQPKANWTGIAWTDETNAQQFANAFNRLLYAAYHQKEEAAKEFSAFRVTAAAWRTLPNKPQLSPEADRHWILAENAFVEKDFESAVANYEAALEIQPTWPAGWFNLAMIYAEQKQYAGASDAMKHYLELVPDAPDAKNARDQMIIWEDKAKR